MYERSSTGFLRAPRLVYVVLVELAAFKLKIVLISFPVSRNKIKLWRDKISFFNSPCFLDVCDSHRSTPERIFSLCVLHGGVRL